MSPDTPPAGPTPSEGPQVPPIEVHAEPTQPDARARVVDAPPSGSAASAPPPAGVKTSRNYAWAVMCHVVGLIDFGAHILFLGLIATLVVWLLRKDEDPEADFHGKEALNFQISLLIWWLVAALLSCCLIGIPILFVLPFAKIGLMLFAAIKAAGGERWRYPLTLRLIT